MTTVHFSACKGRPLGDPKNSLHKYGWCAWWSGEPVMAPFRLPDAHGGAPTRDDVPDLVRLAAPPGATLKWLGSYWAQEHREVLRHGLEARAQLHEQHEREREQWLREAKERAADPAFWAWARYQSAAWVEFRDSLTRAGAPDWASVLGLTLPCTAEDVARAFKARALVVHPDRPGGSHDAFVALEQARRAALMHLGVP